MNALGGQAGAIAVVVARIGDTVLATPALRALREFAGHLTVRAHPKRLDVLQNLDFIDELSSITKRAAWMGGWLRPARHDTAVCYGRDPALLRYCARVARTSVCFDYPELREVEGASLIRVPVPPDTSMHAVDERLLLVQALGASTSNKRLAYTVTQAERESARAWIAGKVPLSGKRLIGLQPFSFPTKAHRDWPIENFVELATRIVRRDPGAMIVILGDEVAAGRAGDFINALPGRCVVAAGEFSLRRSAALMQQLSLYVGVDTGPTHIAGALDMPMVALYHPAYPGRNLAPLDRPRLIAIEHPATGALDRACAASADMGAIPVEQVWAAVSELLSLAP